MKKRSARQTKNNIKKEPETKNYQPANSVRNGFGNFIDVFKNFLLFFVGSVSVFAVFGNEIVINAQKAFFRILKVPFETVRFMNFNIDLPPYFVVNLTIVIILSVYIINSSLKPSERKSENKIKGTSIFLTVSSVLYTVLVFLFVKDTAYLLQIILFFGLIAAFFLYFRKIEKNREPETVNAAILVLSKKELNWLVFAAVSMLVVYMFDVKSWKYSFIGDEYAFYDYGRGLVNGSTPLRILYENGVYSYHPIMSSAWHALFMKIFGVFFGWKLSSAIIPALTIFPLYIWVKKIFNKTVAMIAVASFAIAPSIMGFGHIGYNNIQAVLILVLALMALEFAISKNSIYWTFVAAVVLGLGGYTFYTARLAIVAAGIYWFFHENRKKYSRENLVTGILIYFLTMLFVFINPEFIRHMFMNSVVSGSEIANPSERPIYIFLNYIHSFFAFIYRKTMSHFIAGRTMDVVSAVMILAGMAWTIISFLKDWRARFLITCYAVLVLFVGAIVQYNYPPNTRLYFLVPVLAVIAGVGASRLLALASKIKWARKKYFVLRRVLVFVVIITGLYTFFVYKPSVFQYSPESLIARYMLSEGKNKNAVLATEKYHMVNQMAALYKFDKRLERIGYADIQTYVETGALNNKVLILGDDLIGIRQGLRAYLKPGTIIMDGLKRESAFIFDLTDPEYYKGFLEIWNTNSSYQVQPAAVNAEQIASAPAQAQAPVNRQVQTAAPVKPMIFQAGPCKPKKALAFLPLNNAKLTYIKMFGEGLSEPSDIAVSPDGNRVYICDGIGYKFLVYKKSGDTYKLFKKQRLSYKKGFLGADPRNQEQKEHAYMVYDRDKNLIYLFDGSYDVLKQYDADGNFVKDIFKAGFFHGARSLRMASDGTLAVSLAGMNAVQFADLSGNDKGRYQTPNGAKCGELNQPCFTGFDKSLRRYVVDTLNDRIQIFDKDMKYLDNFPIGKSSTILGPQIIINEKAPQPYMAVTMQYTRSVMFIPLMAGNPRSLELKGEGDVSFGGPAAMAMDENDNLYVLDPRTKVVAKITLPQDPVK